MQARWKAGDVVPQGTEAGAKYTEVSLATLDIAGVEIPWWGSPQAAGPTPLVLFAGLGWRATGCAISGWLGADLPLLAFDMPRRWPRRPLDSTAALAELYAGALDALGVRRARLAGVSMGGMIATRLALDRPDLAAGLTLVSTSAVGARVQGVLRLPAARALPAFLREDSFYHFYRRWGSTLVGGTSFVDERAAARLWMDPMSRRKMSDLLRASTGHDVRDRLGDVRAPTLVVHGTRDPLFPVLSAEELARGIAGARLVLLEGAGHFAFLTRRSQVLEEFHRFWRGEDGDDRSI